jgi:hypothetical protein
MYILLVASPVFGFSVVGAHPDGETAEADSGDASGWASGDDEIWCLPLQGPGDPTGTAVVFTGEIDRGFVFNGPFIDLEAARAWASHSGGHAIELRPIRTNDEAAA